MDTSLAGLLESLLKHVVAEAVNLDVHLGCSDSILGTGHLEVHISEVVLVTEYIGKYGVTVVRALGISDEAHSHTGYRLADLHACVHKGEAAAADGGH